MHAYTLAYTPSGYALDQSWHRVVIKVDGPYKLSYRAGYLATWTGQAGEPERFRMDEGNKVQVRADARKPLLFQVAIVPQGVGRAGRGPFEVSLTFQIPASELAFTHADGRWSNVAIVTSSIYDVTGRVKGGKAQELDTGIPDPQWPEQQKASVSTRQTFQIPKDARYLLINIRDQRSQRTGSLLLAAAALRVLPNDAQVR